MTHQAKGFSLLELMVALSIISILVGATGIWFHDVISLQRLEGAANRLYTDLRLAQSEAVKRNTTVFVSFNAGENDWCYGINLDGSCDCSKANSCRIDGKERTVSSKNFKGVVMQKARFAGGTRYTAFEPSRGFAQAGSTKNGTVWLKSSTDKQLAVIVNRMGRVRFCSPNLEKYTKQCPKAPVL